MKKIFKIVAIIAVFAMVMVGCKKVEMTENSVEISNYSVNQKEAIIKDFAKIIAKLTNQSCFSTFINKQLSDDQVIWYSEMKNQKIDANLSLSELLFLTSKDLRMSYTREFFLTTLPNIIPKLSISMYNYSKEDMVIQDNEKILVFPITDDFSNNPKATQIGFYSDLQTKSYSNFDEPKEKILLVQDNPDYILYNENDVNNEILDLIGTKNNLIQRVIEGSINNLKTKTILVNEKSYKLVPLTQIYDIINETTYSDKVDNRVNNTTKAQRDNYPNNSEQVAAFQIDKNMLKQFCPWTRKYVQIRVKTVFAVKTSSTEPQLSSYPDKYIYTERRNAKENKVCNIDLKLYQWHYNDGEQGNPYALLFTGINQANGNTLSLTFSMGYSVKFKDDSGKETTYNVGGNIGYTIKQTDRDLGGDAVYYQDALNGNWLQYSSGNLFKFSINKAL